nr:reverse transcriptase domain-containing protein [Tanacetum cinerariifolium]
MASSKEPHGPHMFYPSPIEKGKNLEKNAAAHKLAASMVRENDGKIVGKDEKPLLMDIHYSNYVNPKSGQSLNGKPKTGIANPRSGGSVLNGENANPNLNSVSRKVDTTQLVIGTSVLEGMETGNTLMLTGENNTRVLAPNNIEDSFTSLSFENPNDVNLTDQLGNEMQTVDNIWGTTKNYVTNTWGKFGFQSVKKDDDDVYYFKFSTTRGLEQVMEQGPWLIRNQPLILTQWTPNLNLEKNKVKKVSVWVKIHKVHVVAYSEDGLSLIGTQIDRNLKEEVVMAVPRLEGEGHIIETIKVEYEWKTPKCSDCLVFSHNNSECPKHVVEIPKETIEARDGFTMVQNRRKKRKNVANGVPKVNEGMRPQKQKPKYVCNMKQNQNVNAELKASDKEFVMKIMNHFSALQDENITHHTNASDASTSNVQVENGNDQNERRLLWHNIGVHHSMVSGMPWTLLGDFNVALNIEDNLTGGSSMTSAIKMKMLKKPLRKLLHSHGNLHDPVNKLRVELDAVQKALDQDPHNSTLREEEETPKGNGCFKCGASGHFKRDCPKLKNKNGGNSNAQGWVYAVKNAKKNGNAPRNPDSNVITGTFLLNNCYASILFDTSADRSFISIAFTSLVNIDPTPLGSSYDVELAAGKIVGIDTIIRGCTINFQNHPFNIDLMPVEQGSFDVIIRMDWLRRCHAVIVCDEKLVQIPYGNETLTFRGNKSNNGRESRLAFVEN